MRNAGPHGTGKAIGRKQPANLPGAGKGERGKNLRLNIFKNKQRGSGESFGSLTRAPRCGQEAGHGAPTPQLGRRAQQSPEGISTCGVYGATADRLWESVLVTPKGAGGQLVMNLPTTQETRVRFLGRDDPLEKGMATHCSALAWRIPWTEEPGRLQSRGSQELDMT